jgi:hypothetical protein
LANGRRHCPGRAFNRHRIQCLCDKEGRRGCRCLRCSGRFTAAAGPPASLHEDATGITIEVSELPLQALHEFKGAAFLEFLASRGYTNAAYAGGALKRTDAYTYVLADAKGKQGAESRFLLVLGGSGRAAIVTAYAPKSQIDAGRASRGAIETVLSSASIVPAPATKP